MSGKGGVYADEDHTDKKERKVMCLLEKVEVLGKLDKLDRRITAVRGHFFKWIDDHYINKIKTIRVSMQIFPM